MGRKVFHVIHTRSFQSFPNNQPWQVLTALTCWLERYGFRCKVKSTHYATGKERGFNVNNVAKFKLRVAEENNRITVTFEHYAKMKVRTYLAVGALTLGVSHLLPLSVSFYHFPPATFLLLSTGFGVGTLGLIIEEADSLTGQLWRYADTLASAPGLIVSVKRWMCDQQGTWKLETVYPPVDCKLSNIISRSVIRAG